MKQGRKYQENPEDREFVRRCLTAGMSLAETSQCLNLSKETVRKYYRYEIVTSRALLQGKAVKTLEDALHDGSLDAAKFVLARVSKWSETSAHEVSGPNGGPIESQSTLDASGLSDAALQEIWNARQRADSAK